MEKTDKDVMGMLSDIQEQISEEQTKDKILQLKDYIVQLQEQNRRLEYLKEKTKEQKEIANRLSQSYIPDLLEECGMDRVDMATGEKVTVTSDCSVSIKDESKFYKYLEDKGDDAIIKDTMVIVKPSNELKKLVREQVAREEEKSEDPIDTEYDTGRKINGNTLKAYCLREVKKGTEGFPPDSLNLYVYKKTKIK